MQTDQSPHFVQRILDACDMDIIYAAHICGVLPKDISAMIKGRRGQLAHVDQDAVLRALFKYVNARLAGLMAVRDELERKLALDLKKRELQNQRIINR